MVDWLEGSWLRSLVGRLLPSKVVGMFFFYFVECGICYVTFVEDFFGSLTSKGDVCLQKFESMFHVSPANGGPPGR